jgi:hypothetical protein
MKGPLYEEYTTLKNIVFIQKENYSLKSLNAFEPRVMFMV